MKKEMIFKSRVLVWMLTLVMILGLLPGSVIKAQAVGDTAIDATLSLGEFNESTNTFDQATGSGSTAFQSMVIGFNLTKEDERENIALPTVTGFTYQSDISSDY